MTNRELIALLRKPGQVFMPVVMANDVVHLECVKADVIGYLRQLGDNEPAPWRVVENPNVKTTVLDVAS